MEPEQQRGNSGWTVAAAGVAGLAISTALLFSAAFFLFGAHAGLESVVAVSIVTPAVGALLFQSLTGLRGIGRFVGVFAVLLVGTWLAVIALVFLIVIVFKPILFVY